MEPERLLSHSQTARHSSLYCGISIQSILPHPTSLRSIILLTSHLRRHRWVPVTTAWRVLRMRMKELPPIPTVYANILNEQTRTTDMQLSPRLDIEYGDKNYSL